jgi:hypothetical protein
MDMIEIIVAVGKIGMFAAMAGALLWVADGMKPGE